MNQDRRLRARYKTLKEKGAMLEEGIKNNLKEAIKNSQNKKRLLSQNYDLKSADAMHCTFIDDLILQIFSEE